MQVGFDSRFVFWKNLFHGQLGFDICTGKQQNHALVGQKSEKPFDETEMMGTATGTKLPAQKMF